MSAMFNLVFNECERLKSTVLDEASFDANYMQIISQIIPNLNSQCRDYVQTSSRAIRVDVIEQLMRETDFESYKQMVREHFANGTVNPNSKTINFKIPSLKKSLNLHKFEPESINQVYLMIGEDEKKYSKSVVQFNEYCDSFSNSLAEFEVGMIDYRTELLEAVKPLIPQLVEEYESHLFRLKNARAMGIEPEKTYLLKNGKTCEYGTSIAQFVENALRAILIE